MCVVSMIMDHYEDSWRTAVSAAAANRSCRATVHPGSVHPISAAACTGGSDARRNR